MSDVLSQYIVHEERKNIVADDTPTSAVARRVNDYLIRPRAKLLFTRPRADWRLCNDRGTSIFDQLRIFMSRYSPGSHLEYELDGFNRIAVESSEDCAQSMLLKDAIFAYESGLQISPFSRLIQLIVPTSSSSIRLAVA